MSFLERPAGDLLDLFAAGRNVPGAGSAAALQGALAGSLIQAVARYSKAEEPRSRAREITARLRRAVDEDSEAFARFWKSRSQEDLERAIEIPLSIARDCAALAALALDLYETGFKNARGESFAAAWSAIAAGESALYAARANARSPLESSLAEDLRELRNRISVYSNP